MTKTETIQILQSIENRAVDFPYMTAEDWVAIASAKRHLRNSLEVKEVDSKAEKRMKECPFRQVNCTMYKGRVLECNGACSWVVDYLKLTVKHNKE